MILTILVIYMLIIFIVGIWANKYNQNMTDFLLAGRRLGVWLGAFSLAAVHFGGGFVVGLSEFAVESGFVSWWNGLGGGIGLIIVGFMAYKMRGLALFTVPDFLMHRYGSNSLRIISTFLSLIALIGILAAQVSAASGVLEMFGVGSMTGAIIASVMFVIYTAVGGLWAVTLTDFIQIIVGAVGVIVASALVWNRVDGWEGMVNTASGVDKDTYFSLFGSGDFTFILWLSLPIILYTLIGQDFYQRLFATKDAATARNSAIVAGIAICIITVFPVFLGMGAHSLFPNLENSTQVLPMIINEVLPTFVAGIVLAAIMAAIMSTANSILTAGTSHIINDLYIHTVMKKKPHVKSEETDNNNGDGKKLLKLSRIWTLILGAVAIAIAAIAPNIVTLLLMSYTLYTAGVFVPVVGGFMWKRATPMGAMASLLTGVVIAILGIAGVSMGGVPIEILASVISLVVFIIVSLATYKKQGMQTDEQITVKR